MYSSEVDIPTYTDDVSVKLRCHIKVDDNQGDYWEYKEIELDEWALMDLFEALEKIKKKIQ